MEISASFHGKAVEFPRTVSTNPGLFGGKKSGDEFVRNAKVS